MRKAAILSLVLAFGSVSCNRQLIGDVTHRNQQGHPDQWVYRISKDEYKILIDSNGDERPDIVKTYRGGDLVRIESDRNFNGKVDLVQEYSHGVIVREIHDDDFDGRPESIWTFREGKLAMVERDPQERGYADVVEYYDDSGRMIHRELRASDRPLQWVQ